MSSATSEKKRGYSRPSTILPLYFARATAASPARWKVTTAMPFDLACELKTMNTSFTGPTVLVNSVCVSHDCIRSASDAC